MDKRFPGRWVLLVVSVLATYLLIGTVSTGGAAAPIGVLVLVVVLWFSIYRFWHRGLGNRELVTKMRTDLQGTLQGIEERLAQQEAQRRAVAEHEERVLLERERRRAERKRKRDSSLTRDPAVSKYAEMIESRVREGKRTGESEGR